MRDLVTAIRTLTIIPAPGPEGNFGRSFFYFPLVGGLLAGIAFGCFALFGFLFPGQTLLTALLALGLLSWVTGFLHLDGLADTADAFGGGRTAEDILRILKDSRIGSFGAAVLFFDLAAKLLLYIALADKGHVDLIAASLILSRAMQPLFFAYLPYARGPEGKSFGFANATGLRYGLTFEFAALAILALFWIGPPIGVALAAGCLGCLFAGFRFHRKLKGITGDCVGAASEIFEVLFLLGGLTMI